MILISSVLPKLCRKRHSTMHQSSSGIDPAGSLFLIKCTLIKAAKLHIIHSHISMDLLHDNIEQNFFLRISNDLPCTDLTLKRICQAIVPSVLDQWRIFTEFPDLAADLVFFLISQLQKIQLVAEGSGHGNHTSGM